MTRSTVLSKAATLEDSQQMHEQGARGKAAVALHHFGLVDKMDDDITRCGHCGENFVIDDGTVDVKSTSHGYASGCTPLLKVKREKHRENLDRIESDDDDTPDEIMYYLAEEVDSSTVRIVGYCTVQHFDECAEFVAEGEEYATDDPDRRFDSYADNLVAEPSDLWVSFAGD